MLNSMLLDSSAAGSVSDSHRGAKIASRQRTSPSPSEDDENAEDADYDVPYTPGLVEFPPAMSTNFQQVTFHIKDFIKEKKTSGNRKKKKKSKLFKAQANDGATSRWASPAAPAAAPVPHEIIVISDSSDDDKEEEEEEDDDKGEDRIQYQRPKSSIKAFFVPKQGSGSRANYMDDHKHQSNIDAGLQSESSQNSENLADLIDDSELNEADLRQFANWSNRDDRWISMLRQRLGIQTNPDETFGKGLMRKWVAANDPDFERITKEIEEKSLMESGSKKSPWAENLMDKEGRWLNDYIQEITDNMKHHAYGSLYNVHLNDCKWKENEIEGDVNGVKDVSDPTNPSAPIIAEGAKSSALGVDVEGSSSRSNISSSCDRATSQMKHFVGPSESIGLDPNDDGNFGLPLKGPAKLLKSALQALNECLQHYENLKEQACSSSDGGSSMLDVSLSTSILRHTLQCADQCFTVADVTSSQFLIAGICKSDLLVAANDSAICGLNAAALNGILSKAKTSDVQLTFLAVRKKRCLDCTPEPENGPAKKNRQPHQKINLNSQIQKSQMREEKHALEENSQNHSKSIEEEYFNNQTKTYTVLSEKMGFTITRNFEKQVSVVTRVSGVNLSSGTESSPLEKNDVLIKFNNKLACSYATQKRMIRDLKSAIRPLRLTFACAGSDISRINMYLISQQVAERQSAKPALLQTKRDAAALSSTDLKSSGMMGTGNMMGRPKKRRLQLVNRPFSRHESVMSSQQPGFPAALSKDAKPSHVVRPAEITARPKKRTRMINVNNVQDGNETNEQTSSCQHPFHKNATNSSGAQKVDGSASFNSTTGKVPTKGELPVVTKSSFDRKSPSSTLNAGVLEVDKPCIKFMEDEEFNEIGTESEDCLSVKCIIEVLQDEYIDIFYRRRVWHGYLNTPGSNYNKLQEGDLIVYRLNCAEKQQVPSSFVNPKWIACAVEEVKAFASYEEMINICGVMPCQPNAKDAQEAVKLFRTPTPSQTEEKNRDNESVHGVIGFRLKPYRTDSIKEIFENTA